MSKLKPCPVEGCKHKWYSQDGLWQHLSQAHRKHEVIDALIKALILIQLGE